jgi:ubiquitin C-terminal hydrolase
MDLIRYNSDYEVLPVGFNNLGFTCYFNSLLQSLLSCTSFVEMLQNYNEEDISLKFLSYLVKNLKQLEQPNMDQNSLNSIVRDINKLGPICWRAMIKKISLKSVSSAQFAIGQQCAAEGFGILLESLDEFASIQNLFQHRRNNKIFCNECQTYFSKVEEVDNVFKVEATLESEELRNYHETKISKNLNEFLLNQTSIIDENCKCSKCGVKSKKNKESILVMIPEVLFVMSKIYKHENGIGEKLDTYTDFPERLIFKSNAGEDLIYEAVAQIEHLGNLDNGHYYAICKRKGGWFCLNDLGVNRAEFKPSNNTYIVLYHIL